MNPTRGMKRAARLLVFEEERAEGSERADRPGDEPGVQGALEALEGTVARLRGWADSFDDQAPRLRDQRLARLGPVQATGILVAAAAGLLLLFQLWPSEAMPEVQDWGWTIVSREERLLRLPLMEVSVSRGGRMGSPGHPEPASLPLLPDRGPWTAKIFLEQFEFQFQLPQKLAGGWTLERASAIDRRRAVLRYGRGAGQRVTLLLSGSLGDRSATRVMDSPNGRVLLIRRGRLALAVSEADSSELPPLGVLLKSFQIP